MEFRLCHFNTEDELNKLVELQNEVYRERGLHFSPVLFKNWYVNNPDGQVISFNAFDGDQMVAHQSFVPEKMEVDGRIVKCLRSMAVVTHSNYRGRGLFAKLTNLALDEAKRQGYEFAYAISNANSTPIFLKHCGFIQVTRLNVKIGFGTNVKEDGNHIYKRFWTEETLKWRLAMHKYRMYKNSIIGKYVYGVNTYMATLQDNLCENLLIGSKKSNFGVYLYVGLGAKLPFTYIDMPKFIKHSPFNLIFQDLTGGKLPEMKPNNVFYQLLDYDVV